MNLKNLKSWQISFTAVIVSLIIILYFILRFNMLTSSSGDSGNAMAVFILMIIVLPALISSIISTLLLTFDKTKKVGAIVSIIFGTVIIGLLIYLSLHTHKNLIIIGISSNGPQGLLLLTAGIYYFRKKV